MKRLASQRWWLCCEQWDANSWALRSYRNRWRAVTLLPSCPTVGSTFLKYLWYEYQNIVNCFVINIEFPGLLFYFLHVVKLYLFDKNGFIKLYHHVYSKKSLKLSYHLIYFTSDSKVNSQLSEIMTLWCMRPSPG